EREWAKLCVEVLDAPEAVSDPATATNVARVQNRERTDQLVAAALARMTGQQALKALTQADIAFARVNDMQGLAEHSELKRIEVDTQAGKVSIPRPGPNFVGAMRHYGPVPALAKEKAR